MCLNQGLERGKRFRGDPVESSLYQQQFKALPHLCPLSHPQVSPPHNIFELEVTYDIHFEKH
jgi:hypothetical protein